MSERIDDLAQAVSSYGFIFGKVIPSANLLGKDKSVVIIHDDLSKSAYPFSQQTYS
jgi:hypothetical protein